MYNTHIIEIFSHYLPAYNIRYMYCMSKASCMQLKELLLSVHCIIVAIITVKKRVIADTQCKMVEEWDQNYITLFLFAVETANYFHQQNSTYHHLPRGLFPSQLLREHVAMLTCEAEASGGRWLLQWIAGLLCWRFHLLQHMETNVSLVWRMCVCVCLYPPRQTTPSIPKCNPARLNTPRAPCRMPIPKLLSFSMNAQVCKLAATNWIRIRGGFIPSGSAWSPVFHCNYCQSWGGTEVHIWTGGFVPAFNSACLSSQCKPLLK